MQEGSHATFPFFSLLGLIFITLKLTGHIAWSWWWVLAPFWIPFALVGGFLLGIIVLALFGKMKVWKK